MQHDSALAAIFDDAARQVSFGFSEAWTQASAGGKTENGGPRFSPGAARASGRAIDLTIPCQVCFPAKPNSVSSGAAAYHEDQQRLKAIPQRTLESMPPKIPPLNRQRSCPCIFFGGPIANPALRPVGLGHLAAIDLPRGPPRNGSRSADSPDGGGRRRGFALFCLATDCLTLLPMADQLRPMRNAKTAGASL